MPKTRVDKKQQIGKKSMEKNQHLVLDFLGDFDYRARSAKHRLFLHFLEACTLTENETLAYMAGFFDGEGCIGLYRHKEKPKISPYRLQIKVTQVIKGVLDLFQKRYGGSIFNNQNHLQNPKMKNCYAWIAHCKIAEACLRDLAPFLIVKKMKAELAIAFREAGRMTRNPKDKIKPANKAVVKRRKVVYNLFKVA